MGGLEVEIFVKKALHNTWMAPKKGKFYIDILLYFSLPH